MPVCDRGVIKEPASTPVTSKGITQAIQTKLINKFLAKYANVFMTSQGHGLCVHVWTLLSESRMDSCRVARPRSPFPAVPLSCPYGLIT